MKKSMLVLVFVLAISLIASSLVAAADYQIRLGHGGSIKDVRHLASLLFKKEVEERSNGKVTVNIFPSSQLGNIRDMVEGLRMGTIQVVVDVPSRLTVYTTESHLADIFKMPYVIKSKEHGERVWASQVGQELLDQIAAESGVKIVSMGWRGARHITSTKPIYSLDDMEGLKIRTPPYDPPITTFKVLGANPTPMDFNEVYMALQQGVIEAQENPIATSYGSAFYEVCKYLVLSGHVKEFSSFMMGNGYYNGLPADIRQVIQESADIASEYYSTYVLDHEAEYLETFKENGVEIVEVDVEAWKAKLHDWVYSYQPALTPYIEKIEAIK